MGIETTGIERDELGPAKVLHLWDPGCELSAIVVVDNVACGAAIGGVRMAADVTTEEVFRLARAMTLKNAAAGLPHGGGKAGIRADPHTADRERLVRAFARAIRDVVDYVPGPDMGTDEGCMAWVRDEIGRAAGLPRVLGGVPLDEIGATGFGLARTAEVAAEAAGVELAGARVAIEGFGNVGQHAARFLEELGAVLVGASDSRGAIHAPDGISSDELVAFKRESGSVEGCPGARAVSQAELLELPCDVLVPAARPDTIDVTNEPRVQARLILQGANIPITLEAERALAARGVLSVPDFIANAGGVIAASVEVHGGTESAAFEAITEKIRRNVAEVLESVEQDGVLPREAAERLALARVREAQGYRRGAS